MNSSDMTRVEQFDKNLDLFHEHMSAVLDDPSLIESVPNAASLVFIPDDDQELAERNLAMGIELVRRGEDVYFRHTGRVTATAR